MKKSISYILIFLAMQVFATWAAYAAWLTCSGFSMKTVMEMFLGTKPLVTSGGMIILGSAVCNILLAALFLWRHWTEVSPAWLRIRQWDVLLWSGASALGTLLPSMGLQELLPEVKDLSGETFRLIVGNNLGYVVLCLLVPVVEEMIFRGAVLRTLLDSMKSRWAAIALSAALFALAHLNPAQMPHAFLMGLLLGWMYSRTGSILPGVVFHFVNNTLAYVGMLFYSASPDVTLTQLFGGDPKRIAMAIGFSLCILLPAIFQLNIRMKTAK